MNKLVVALIATVSASVWAETDPYADYIKLTKSFSSAAWTGPTDWGDGTGNHPSKDYNYLVPKGTILAAPGAADSNPWLGGQLVIEGEFRSAVSSSSQTRPSVDDLVFLPGSRLATSTVNAGLSGGTFTVLATTDEPLVVDSVCNKSGVTYKYEGSSKFVGDGGSGILFGRPIYDYVLTHMFCADNFASFLGSVMLRSAYTTALLMPSYKQGTYVFGGTLEVSDGASITLVNNDANYKNLDTVSVANLVVTNGGIVKVRMLSKVIHPVLSALQSLRIGDGGVYDITVGDGAYDYTSVQYAGTSGGIPFDSRNEFRIATLTAEAVANFAVDSSSIVFPADATGLLPFRRHLRFADAANGGKDVYLAFDNIVPTRLDSETSQSKRGSNLFNTDKFWSTWKCPATNEFSGCMFASHRMVNTASVLCPNGALVIGPGCPGWTMYGGTEVVLGDLAWMPGGTGRIQTWSTPTMTFRGGTWHLVGSGERWMEAGNANVMTVESDLRGDGTLHMVDQNLNGGAVNLAGDNRAFSGRLVFERSTLGTEATGFRTALGAASQWGGAHVGDGDDWNAVTFINSPLVSVTGDVAFTEPTRGFYVDGAVRFDVAEGRSLTLGNPVAYSGTLKKLGAGTLVLSGAAQFADNGELVDAPVVGKSELIVMAGGLEVASKTAADGLSLTFAEGSRLIVRPDGQGVYDVKSQTPLASTCADGRIPVEIVGLTRDGGDAEVVLCTVSDAAAADLSADSFKVLRTASGHRAASVEKRTAADGNVAYVANMKILGLSVIIR